MRRERDSREFRSRLEDVPAFHDPTELADRVEREHARIVVTRHGRPTLVLLSPDDLESMEETIEILRDPELVASLRRSREEAASGQRLRLRDHV